LLVIENICTFAVFSNYFKLKKIRKMKKLLLFTTFALFATISYCQSNKENYKTVNIENIGNLRIGTVLDILNNTYTIEDNDDYLKSTTDFYNKNGYITQKQYDVLTDYISTSKAFNLITKKDPNKLTVNELMSDNNTYQKQISKSLRNIAICTSITTTTLMVGILAGIIYASTYTNK
jgi:membrane-associated HD superfamily phosphohydrolase